MRAAQELHACNLGFRDGHELGAVYLVTLTLRHPAGMARELRQLEPMRRACTQAYQEILRGRRRYEWCKRFGILAAVRALEVTHSPATAAWHPHIHALLFVRHRLSPAQLAELRSWYAEAWGDAIVAEGYERPLTAGIDVRDADKAGRYLTKMGLLDVSSEVASGTTKHGRCPKCGEHKTAEWSDGRRRCSDCGTEMNRSPMQILADFHEHGEKRDRALWLHYYRGILRARRLTWTRWKDSSGRPFQLRELYVPQQEALTLPAPVQAIALNPKAFKALPAERWSDAVDAFELGDRAALETALGDAMPAAQFPRDPDEISVGELEELERETRKADHREMRLAGEDPWKKRRGRMVSSSKQRDSTCTD